MGRVNVSRSPSTDGLSSRNHRHWHGERTRCAHERNGRHRRRSRHLGLDTNSTRPAVRPRCSAILGSTNSSRGEVISCGHARTRRLRRNNVQEPRVSGCHICLCDARPRAKAPRLWGTSPATADATATHAIFAIKTFKSRTRALYSRGGPGWSGRITTGCTAGSADIALTRQSGGSFMRIYFISIKHILRRFH